MKSTASIFKSENFDNFLMTHIDVVRDFLKEVRVEAYVPEILVLDTNGKILVIKLFFNDNKYKVVKQAGAMCYQRKNHPVAAIMVFEAWIREQQADQPFSSRPISSYADKQEVISFDGMTYDGRRNGAILWFNRRKDNSIVLDNNKFNVITTDQKEEAGLEGELLPQFFQGYKEEFLKERN
jgi:hypothetical protein